MEYERSSYRVAKFRDAVAALYEKHRLDAPPPCRDAVRDFVLTKNEALAQYKNGRLDKAVDAMRHLKTTEWTLRLGDVQGPIGAPRDEPRRRAGKARGPAAAAAADAAAAVAAAFDAAAAAARAGRCHLKDSDAGRAPQPTPRREELALRRPRAHVGRGRVPCGSIQPTSLDERVLRAG